jgi:hypothetical protein
MAKTEATLGIAIGSRSTSKVIGTNGNGIAIGAYSSAGYQSIAIGAAYVGGEIFNTTANGTGDIAIGHNAHSNTGTGIAIGFSCTAESNGIGIGKNVTAVANTTVIGNSSTTNATIYGLKASSVACDTTNFNNILSSADNTIQKALDTLDNQPIVFNKAGNNDIRIGAGASSSEWGISIGHSADVGGGVNIAHISIGNSSKVTGDFGIAIGDLTTAGEYGVALGAKTVSDAYAIAIGGGSNNTGDAARATGLESIAIGRSAKTDGTLGIALGSRGSSQGIGIAIGAYSSAANAGIAIGSGYASGGEGFGATTTSGGIAIGHNVHSNGRGVAIGFSTFTGDNAIAIGAQVTAGTNCIQIGTTSNTSLDIGGVAAGTGAVMLVNGTRISYQPSVRAAKDNIAEYTEDPFPLLNALQPKTFTLKADPEKRPQVGYIAEDVLEIDGRYTTYSDGKLAGLDYARFVVPLIEAVKTLNGRVQELEISNSRRSS